jgi:hypothetical protein
MLRKQCLWGKVGLSWSKFPNANKGAFQQTGLKGAPKGICTDRDIGTWKAANAEKKASKKRFHGNMDL